MLLLSFTIQREFLQLWCVPVSYTRQCLTPIGYIPLINFSNYYWSRHISVVDVMHCRRNILYLFFWFNLSIRLLGMVQVIVVTGFCIYGGCLRFWSPIVGVLMKDSVRHVCWPRCLCCLTKCVSCLGDVLLLWPLVILTAIKLVNHINRFWL